MKKLVNWFLKPGMHLFKSKNKGFYFNTVKNGKIISRSSERDNYETRTNAIKGIIADMKAKGVMEFTINVWDHSQEVSVIHAKTGATLARACKKEDRPTTIVLTPEGIFYSTENLTPKAVAKTKKRVAAKKKSTKKKSAPKKEVYPKKDDEADIEHMAINEEDAFEHDMMDESKAGDDWDREVGYERD